MLIACFGDPGLLALRDIARVPVAGLAQASFLAAARGPFAVVTGGTTWGPMLERFARTHQPDGQLVAIRTVELTGAQIAAEPEPAMDDLALACQAGIESGAKSIVLGGAALAGLSSILQARLGISVLDNVLLGAQAVVHAMGAERHVRHSGGAGVGLTLGIAPELAMLLA